jgi:hypothetical protein
LSVRVPEPPGFEVLLHHHAAHATHHATPSPTQTHLQLGPHGRVCRQALPQRAADLPAAQMLTVTAEDLDLFKIREPGGRAYQRRRGGGRQFLCPNVEPPEAREGGQPRGEGLHAGERLRRVLLWLAQVVPDGNLQIGEPGRHAAERVCDDRQLLGRAAAMQLSQVWKPRRRTRQSGGELRGV